MLSRLEKSSLDRSPIDHCVPWMVIHRARRPEGRPGRGTGTRVPSFLKLIEARRNPNPPSDRDAKAGDPLSAFDF